MTIKNDKVIVDGLEPVDGDKKVEKDAATVVEDKPNNSQEASPVTETEPVKELKWTEEQHQTELGRIAGKVRAEEAEKYKAQIEELTSFKEQVDELKTEKATFEVELSQANKDATRYRVAFEEECPPDLVNVIKGDTEEELRANLSLVLKGVKKDKAPSLLSKKQVLEPSEQGFRTSLSDYLKLTK